MPEEIFEVKMEEVTTQERQITCVCGATIPVERHRVVKDDIPEGWTYCERCNRLYAPVQLGSEPYQFKLLGFPCVWCDNIVPKLYFHRRGDKEPECCEKCLKKSIEDLPDEIAQVQNQLAYAIEQLRGQINGKGQSKRFHDGTKTFTELCRLNSMWGLSVSFQDDDDLDEVIKAAPYLNYKDHGQILAEGSAIVLCDTEEEVVELYKRTVGDDGPTKLNDYDGPVKVYARVCNPQGEVLFENT
jgi:hypothetical protein